MKIRNTLGQVLGLSLLLLMAVAPAVFAQDADSKPVFKQEELDQMLAPIALYPDTLLAQVLMATTYPIEIVQADRFAKQHKDLKGDKLLEAAKNEDWDPTVKSLLQFPEVIAMMSEKLDWTTKLGDAFLAQKKDVMDAVQRLRKKAQETGNLKTTKEQIVVVEKETIIIQPSNPQVIYVPSYSPTVVYGTWAYPAYPPYPYYPPGYGMAFGFIAGVAVGSSGCCWGNCNWGGGDIDIDVNRNNNFTRNNYSGDRVNHYQKQGGQGGRQQFQHNPQNRKGAAYRDNSTAQRYNKGTSAQAASRDANRGRTEQGRQGQASQTSSRGGSQQGGGAFSGMDRGSGANDFSSRGQSSRQSMSSSSGGFGGGSRGGSSGFSGGSRGGGGGFSGGSRGGGGGGRGGGGGGRR